MSVTIETKIVYKGMQLRNPADIMTVIESLESNNERLATELSEERDQRQRLERALINERLRSKNKLIEIRRLFKRLTNEVDNKIGTETEEEVHL